MRLWSDPDVTEILYGGSKGSAKSCTGCCIMVTMALMYPGTFYFIARKRLHDIRRFTLPSIYEVFDLLGISSGYYRYDGSLNMFEFYNGSRIYLLHAAYLPSDPLYERFGSMQMTQGWIEEAGEFSLEAKTNLQASIGRWKNSEYNLPPKLLQTCNPSYNYLYSTIYKPWKDGTLPEWIRFVQAFPQDNKMLPPGYIENLTRTFSLSQYRRLVLGEWEFDDDPNLLVDYDSICDVFTNDHVREEGDKRMSTDLAGKGRDKWVVGVATGDVVRIPIVQKHSEGKEMEEKLKQIASENAIPRSRIVSDADGLGFYLESYMKGIREFKGGKPAEDSETYNNIKSECAFKLAEKINKRQIRIICSDEIAEIIKKELMLLRSTNTNSAEQKKAIISKDRMKELNAGESPDVLDMLIMMQIFDVKPKAQGVTTAQIIKNRKR